MNQFVELGVEDKIIKAIEEMEFEVPTPVQAEVIPHLMNEEFQDLISLAQTGTGKTAAFGIPLVQKVDTGKTKIQYLILSPTRELCLQIADDLASFAKYKPEIKIVPVFGGSSIDRQIQLIRKGVHIISATPGRLVDLIQRGIVNLSEVKIVVLDEADEMLNMGFRDDLETILETTPTEKNTLLFSATMPNEVRAIANKYMHDPHEIVLGKKNAGAENVHHVCYIVNAKDRYLALKRIVDYHPEIYGIIFCRTRKETQEVADLLINDGYNADSLHGDLSQAQRDIVMNKFRIRHLQLLVATDVAARGLDVEHLTHIINYNLPEELEIYTHRSGRTGRAGRSGTSIIICSIKDKSKIPQIEKKINKKFTYAKIPLGKEICAKQLLHLVDRVEKVEVDYTQIDPYLPDILRKLEWLDREELIKKFVSVEFNRFLEYYKKMADLSVPAEPRKSGKSKGDVSGFTRFFINLGRIDELRPNTLMGLINEYTGISDIEIGEIEILKTFSFFEADSDFADTIMKSFQNKEYKKRKIDLELSQSKSRGKDRGDGRERDKFRSKKEFGSRDRGFRSERRFDRGGEKPRRERSFDNDRPGRDRDFGKKKFDSDRPRRERSFDSASDKPKRVRKFDDESPRRDDDFRKKSFGKERGGERRFDDRGSRGDSDFGKKRFGGDRKEERSFDKKRPKRSR